MSSVSCSIHNRRSIDSIDRQGTQADSAGAAAAAESMHDLPAFGNVDLPHYTDCPSALTDFGIDLRHTEKNAVGGRCGAGKRRAGGRAAPS